MRPPVRLASTLALALLSLLGCSRGGVDAPPDQPAADLAAADLAGLALDLRTAGDLRPAPSAQLSFGPAATFAAPLFAYHLAVGRIDGDELDDLLVSGRPAASVYLSRGDGALTVKPLDLLANWQVAIADMNRDGKGDLLLSDTSNNAVTIALGNGDGSVRTPPLSAAAGTTPQGVTAADVNGDGIPDALAVDQAGAELGMSKSWASRQHAQAVEALRAVVDAELSPASPEPDTG